MCWENIKWLLMVKDSGKYECSLPKGGPFGLVSFGFAALLNMHRGFVGCKRDL